jgi:DNA-binding NarL/FixJ family response regulator
MLDLRHRQYIRILLIEEEGLVRAALVALVTSWEGFHIVAEATTEVEALEHCRRVNPDVVLLSIDGTEDATLVPEISRACGRRRLLVLLSHCPEDLRLVMTGLAKRVVAKTENPKELKKAIQDIYSNTRIRTR